MPGAIRLPASGAVARGRWRLARPEHAHGLRPRADIAAGFIRQDTLPTVQSDTLRIEVTRIVQLWQSSRTRPQSVFLRLGPEGATFARGVFFSTRSAAGGVLVAPRLRITFQRSFPFENP